MIPKGDNKKYWLNEFGRRYWVRKDNPTYFATIPYHWVDMVNFIDESEVDSDVNSINFGYRYRKYVDSVKFSDFILKDDDWVIMDIKYERKQKLEKLKECLEKKEK